MSDNTALAAPASNQGPTTPRKGPPKFKQRQTRQFKSKPPKKGVKGFGDDIPGMEGLGTGKPSTDLSEKFALGVLPFYMLQASRGS
ncbi:PREDICTED: retinal cone rhodopsin-sensitive cGMP 3',5'-cyclic phosphodiesterase subunit gamma [Colobus angolensis palliatus]|uniref:Retinal cone rhodopsin-sensitive cGMP 3',5'-cyclic phosphodiesterase subunit gamma n=2 Tax=Cercopithecidae TaxID=9527 RepID=A0A5F7ZL80_MACMU|nr:PREDICTED: retinal cone rhodopsin-sensitive cGMP 3',5'-cyclic phosphodiesterase subunit gamma [Colobus angolensis palliatus]